MTDTTRRAYDETGLTLRPLTGPGELGLFTRLPYVLNAELADDLAAGRRRPEWMWVALRGERVLARAAWWARTGTGTPFLLDVLDIADGEPGAVEAGALLLTRALARVVAPGTQPPPYCRFVPPAWRDDAAVRGAVEARRDIAACAGARPFVERLRFTWRADTTPLPEAPGGPLFRPVRDPGELVTLMTGVLDGTLDAHSRHDLARMPAHEAARRHFDDELAGYDSPRDWWRVATTPAGDPVGFVVPARNAYHPIIAYLGVLPAHRGNGHAGALLAEGTRVLVAAGADHVRASTDLGNVPMAEAFRRAGYGEFERELDMTWG